MAGEREQDEMIPEMTGSPVVLEEESSKHLKITETSVSEGETANGVKSGFSSASPDELGIPVMSDPPVVIEEENSERPKTQIIEDSVSEDGMTDGLKSGFSTPPPDEFGIRSSDVPSSLSKEIFNGEPNCGERNNSTSTYRLLMDLVAERRNSQRRRLRLIRMIEAELDDFFLETNKEILEQFKEKYNFDFEKEEPLEGKYEWTKMDP